jgi:hypothetical protein
MSLEKEVKLKNKKANLQKLILGTVAITGVLAIGLVAPNVLWAMKKLGLFPHKRQKESILSSRKRLIQKSFLEYNKKGMLRITPKGKRYLIIETYLDKTKEKKPKWDGKWRVLIFDIPENRKNDRENLRHTLISIGFMQLQKSVWIYPYDCEDLITLLKVDLEIGKDVLYMIVEALEYDKPVKKYFSLN